MFLEKFIKTVYISFYKDEEYKLLCEIKKNNKTLESLKKEFDSKEKLIEFINIYLEDYARVYISTFVNSINQGIVPSCNKNEYKKREIEIENIKYLCINNNYSIYISIYDLMTIKKEFPFEIDFIYSIFAPIDFTAKHRNNTFYVLILQEKIAIIGYKNNIPIYSDIFELKEENDENDEVEDDIELLEEIDLEDEISEDIEEEAENIEIEEKPEDLTLTTIEHNIVKNLKDAIKDYYENYSDDFLEKIIFLDTINIGNDIKKLTEDELLLDSNIINFDLPKILNILSERENV